MPLPHDRVLLITLSLQCGHLLEEVLDVPFNLLEALVVLFQVEMAHDLLDLLQHLLLERPQLLTKHLAVLNDGYSLRYTLLVDLLHERGVRGEHVGDVRHLYGVCALGQLDRRHRLPHTLLMLI